MRTHQLPSYKKHDSQKHRSRSNFTAVNYGVGGSTAATIEMHECSFCQERSRHAFPMMLMRALYQKFAASQNYFYSKDVNEILQQQRGTALIHFKDSSHFDEREEYLKRSYLLNEYGGKIKMLSEYYKYHHDVPRLFMLPVSLTVSKYHDRKRRVEYVRITKMLNIQPEAESTLEQPMPLDHKSLECLLDMLNETKSRPHINIVDEQQIGHFMPQHKVVLNTLASESNTLQEINMRLCEIISAVSPKNPYLPTANMMVQVTQERLTDMNLPKPFLRVEQPTRVNRKTEPDLKKNYDKPLQMHPATKRKMHSLASHQDTSGIPSTRTDTQIRSHINTFFQATKESSKPQHKVTPLSSERQHSRSKNSVSPSKWTKTYRPNLDTREKSARDKSAHSNRPDPRSNELLRLLQQKSFTKNPAPQPKQDPIIAQLIQKLQQGNSNLFQQLLSATEKFRTKIDENPPSQRSQQRNTQRSTQQSQSNLSSLLRPVVKPKPTPPVSQQKSTTRAKRVNSQNMESNPFHLNLDRINITQRLQTSRETARDSMPQRSVYQESLTKRVRSRGSINSTQGDVSKRLPKKSINF